MTLPGLGIALFSAPRLAPVNLVAPVASGSTVQGNTVFSTTGIWSNAPSSYLYQWKRGGAAIAGATNSSYVLTIDDVGVNVRCLVTATNLTGLASTNSNILGPITSPGSNPPFNTVRPVIFGTITQGNTLTTTNGTWTNSPSFAYQWNRGGVAISGATGTTYTLVLADVGAIINCTVTGTNIDGSDSANSNNLGPVLIAAPTNSVAPVISGTAAQDNTLTTTNGTWTGSPTFTYQWTRNNVNIGGATSSSYLLVAADVGTTTRCVVNGTNVSGNASATSNAIGPISAAVAASLLAATVCKTTSGSNITSFDTQVTSANGNMVLLGGFVGGASGTLALTAIWDPAGAAQAFTLQASQNPIVSGSLGGGILWITGAAPGTRTLRISAGSALARDAVFICYDLDSMSTAPFAVSQVLQGTGLAATRSYAATLAATPANTLVLGLVQAVVPAANPLATWTMTGITEDGETSSKSATGGNSCVYGHLRVVSPMTGINMAGGEFSATQDKLPGVFNQDYAYPLNTFGYWAGKGIYLMRIPFRLERLEHTDAKGVLNASEITRITASFDAANAQLCKVLFDCHNYMHRFDGNDNKEIIGIAGSSYSTSDFATFWGLIATQWKNHPVFQSPGGFDIMNEPSNFDVATNPSLWVDNANAAIVAIRATGYTGRIYVGGDSFSTASRWDTIGPRMLNVVDSGNNLWFEAHQYFDSNQDGIYGQPAIKEFPAAKNGFALDETNPNSKLAVHHRPIGAGAQKGIPAGYAATAGAVVTAAVAASRGRLAVVSDFRCISGSNNDKYLFDVTNQTNLRTVHVISTNTDVVVKFPPSGALPAAGNNVVALSDITADQIQCFSGYNNTTTPHSAQTLATYKLSLLDYTDGSDAGNPGTLPTLLRYPTLMLRNGEVSNVTPPVIQHALAATATRTTAPGANHLLSPYRSWPAFGVDAGITGSDNQGDLPYGTLLYIPLEYWYTVDTMNLNPRQRVIAECLKSYGCYLVEGNAISESGGILELITGSGMSTTVKDDLHAGLNLLLPYLWPLVNGRAYAAENELLPSNGLPYRGGGGPIDINSFNKAFDATGNGGFVDQFRGSERLEAYRDWLRINSRQGIIGEYGAPAGDFVSGNQNKNLPDVWEPTLRQFTTNARLSNIPLIAWAGGERWALDYELRIQPTGTAPNYVDDVGLVNFGVGNPVDLTVTASQDTAGDTFSNALSCVCAITG